MAEHKSRGLAGKLRALTRVRVLVPIVVGVSLIAYVMSVAVDPQSGAQMMKIVWQTWWVVLVLTVPYLVLRALIWHDLLDQLGIQVPWRQLLVAFAGGEMTKNLPAGLYVQSYLLARLEDFGQEGVARASMASIAMLGLEAAIAVPVAAAFGWPGIPWVRWALLGIVGFWVAILFLAWLLVRYGERHLPRGAPDWVRQVIQFLELFLAAGGELATWRTARLLVPAAAYMFVYVVDLYVICGALGLNDVSLLDATGMYAFVVLSVILVPIPTEIGLTEFSGLMVLVAYGIRRPTAAVIILALRALATGTTIALSGVVLLALRGQLTQLEGNRRSEATEPTRAGGPAAAAHSDAEASGP